MIVTVALFQATNHMMVRDFQDIMQHLKTIMKLAHNIDMDIRPKCFPSALTVLFC